MLKFKDFQFKEKVVEQGIFTVNVKPYNMEKLLKEVNTWKQNHSHFRIINVETLILPFYGEGKKDGTKYDVFFTENEGTNVRKVIRVWYEIVN